MITNTNTYNPDYAVHPGEILEETLAARDIKKNDLAERCGLSAKTISQILNKKAPLTADTAVQLERVLGISADIWNNLDAQYRLFEAKTKEKERNEEYVQWAKDFPIKSLQKMGIIPPGNDTSHVIESLLCFFGVNTPKSWEKVYGKIYAAYRKSERFTASDKSIISWLRIGIKHAESIDTEKYDSEVFIRNLKRIRELTMQKPSEFEHKMKELCRESGVVLVFVPELPRMHLCGATKWLSKGKALIMLTFRYKSNDQFWFTFFHEAAHILLHGKKENYIDQKDTTQNKEEDEANKFARDFLVPPARYKDFVKDSGKILQSDIIKLAAEINIDPGIIVGRLQHDKLLPYSYFNNLKIKYSL